MGQTHHNQHQQNKTRQPFGDNQVNNQTSNSTLDEQYLIAKKRRVVKFVRCWMLIAREHFFQQTQIQTFLRVSSDRTFAVILFVCLFGLLFV